MSGSETTAWPFAALDSGLALTEQALGPKRSFYSETPSASLPSPTRARFLSCALTVLESVPLLVCLMCTSRPCVHRVLMILCLCTHVGNWLYVGMSV